MNVNKKLIWSYNYQEQVPLILIHSQLLRVRDHSDWISSLLRLFSSSGMWPSILWSQDRSFTPVPVSLHSDSRLLASLKIKYLKRHPKNLLHVKYLKRSVTSPLWPALILLHNGKPSHSQTLCYFGLRNFLGTFLCMCTSVGPAGRKVFSRRGCDSWIAAPSADVSGVTHWWRNVYGHLVGSCKVGRKRLTLFHVDWIQFLSFLSPEKMKKLFISWISVEKSEFFFQGKNAVRTCEKTKISDLLLYYYNNKNRKRTLIWRRKSPESIKMICPSSKSFLWIRNFIIKYHNLETRISSDKFKNRNTFKQQLQIECCGLCVVHLDTDTNNYCEKWKWFIYIFK